VIIRDFDIYNSFDPFMGHFGQMDNMISSPPTAAKWRFVR
jgi:hypothetical protein